MNIAKIRKTFLLSQYPMSFSGRHDEVVYIMVSIKLRFCKYMDDGHYVCHLLDNNTGTWCNCDYDKKTNYSEYPENV